MRKGQEIVVGIMLILESFDKIPSFYKMLNEIENSASSEHD